jgi:hypothetical protein
MLAACQLKNEKAPGRITALAVGLLCQKTQPPRHQVQGLPLLGLVRA